MDKVSIFKGIFRASRAMRERLTPMGRVVAGLTGFAAAFGLDTQLNLAHTLFALGAAFLAVDAMGAALARRRPPCLTVVRSLPEFVTVGEAARYGLDVRNTGARPLPPLQLAEELRQPWPAATDLARYPAAQGVGRFDRRVGYPLFLDLLRRLRALKIDPVQLPVMLPGQAISVRVPAHPTARGLAVFERLWLLVPGPLGLVQTRLALEAPLATLPVLPARLPFELPPAQSRRLWQPGGIALAQRVGDAEEFRSLRDYRPGDPLRSIHWRSFARTGRPVVREFQEEFFSRQALALDTAAPYPFAPALEQAVSMAAWLVTRPREADTLLDLLFVGDRVHQLTTGRGLGETSSLLRVLAGVTPTPPGTIESLLATVERHAEQASSLILILLAWDEARKNAVRRLLARGLHPVVLLLAEADLSEQDPLLAETVRVVRPSPGEALP